MSITTLRKLEIRMPEEFIVQRIHGIDGRGGPDHDKICHVPVIAIESYGSKKSELLIQPTDDSSSEESYSSGDCNCYPSLKPLLH